MIMKRFVLALDQSTSGTKALLLDAAGRLLDRRDLPHEQIINDRGWVSHDPEEIYRNTVQVLQTLVTENGVAHDEIAALGISNQRETSVIWSRKTGKPLNNAVVWQCTRSSGICETLSAYGEEIRRRTGLRLSPYFPASKFAWLIRNSSPLPSEELCLGTVDAWLVFRLTGGRVFATDYSNASRTQLLNLETLSWDPEICGWFGIDPVSLPEVRFSDGDFGQTDLEGFLACPVPIRGVLGDSHAALFAQGCLSPGMVKATYGTGSSVMMNIGNSPVRTSDALVTSLAWGMNGTVHYVLEGNINYTGSVIKWLVDDVKLLDASRDAGILAEQADPSDRTYIVPAFTGLGAPYWNDSVRAMICGMSRTTGQKEIVRAAEECIVYQICDVLFRMQEESGITIRELRVDGGPTRDRFLMQFQSDMLDLPVCVPEKAELSGIGAGCCAGIAAGLYPEDVVLQGTPLIYEPVIDGSLRKEKLEGWHEAVRLLLHGGKE